MTPNFSSTTNVDSNLISKPHAITDTIFNQKGTNFFVEPSGNRGIDHTRLPAGNYVTKFNTQRGYYLEAITEFPPIKKVYGDVRTNADRILKTYLEKAGNLGVLLDGLKGSGKTLTARLISIMGNKMGIPTLLINSAYTGDAFFQFLYSIQQECIVFFDEFEKVYDDDDQQSLLTVLDGTFPSKKLFLLTSNSTDMINIHLKNRPGRIHYHINFKGLSGEFIKEYIQDNLDNKLHEKELLSVCSMFSPMNFDSLATLVWEMNLYQESASKAIKLLNAKPGSDQVEIFLVSLKLKNYNFIFQDNLLKQKTFQGSPLRLSNFNPIPMIPASCKVAAELMGISEKEVLPLHTLGFEVSRTILEEMEITTSKKAKQDLWDEHAYSYDYYIERGEIVHLLRIHEGMTGGKEIQLYFSYNDLVEVEVSTGTFVFVNNFGNTLKLTRLVEETLDLLSYLPQY